MINTVTYTVLITLYTQNKIVHSCIQPRFLYHLLYSQATQGRAGALPCVALATKTSFQRFYILIAL